MMLRTDYEKVSGNYVAPDLVLQACEMLDCNLAQAPGAMVLHDPRRLRVG